MEKTLPPPSTPSENTPSVWHSSQFSLLCTKCICFLMYPCLTITSLQFEGKCTFQRIFYTILKTFRNQANFAFSAGTYQKKTFPRSLSLSNISCRPYLRNNGLSPWTNSPKKLWWKQTCCHGNCLWEFKEAQEVGQSWGHPVGTTHTLLNPQQPFASISKHKTSHNLPNCRLFFFFFLYWYTADVMPYHNQGINRLVGSHQLSR